MPAAFKGLMLNVLWSLGLDRPLAYFLVLLHNVFTEMYYIFMCFTVNCICGRNNKLYAQSASLN